MNLLPKNIENENISLAEPPLYCSNTFLLQGLRDLNTPEAVWGFILFTPGALSLSTLTRVSRFEVLI